jgi:lipopolysaccharide export system protein LptA
MLVYNIAEQRINAGSSGEEDGRVRITYTPANGLELPGREEEDETTPDENQ